MLNPFRKIYDSKEFKEHKKSKFPYLVDIELTNHCNLKCLFCPAAQAMTRKRGYMSEKTFKKVIDECAEHNTPVRFIRWGEPFLHPKIINFCKYVKSKGLLLHITNNGLAIKEKHMKDLIKLEVDSLIFSMQGATKEEYERMRDIRYFDRYAELETNIRNMMKLRGKKKKPFIQITSTMLDDTEQEIEDFKKYWSKVVDSVNVGKTILFWNPVRMTKVLQKKYRPCTEVHQKLSIDWDGKVTCCCGDYDNFLTVGDINKSKLVNIWKNEKINAIRTLLDNGMHRSLTKCSTCQKAYEKF